MKNGIWKISMYTVHPRVCGEHWCIKTHYAHRSGSSPRLRGTFFFSHSFLPLYRFIPASAGNILCFLHNGSKKAVHPRVCGEHTVFLPLARQFYGSSPRLRGTCLMYLLIVMIYRFIPASAGNISNLFSRSISHTVHPRVCGEHGKV